MAKTKRSSSEAPKDLLTTLQQRFAAHPRRHPGVAWEEVAARLGARRGARDVLAKMESTGGEPDVIGHDPKTGTYLFVDCAPESPAGRRSLCYDREAWAERKEHRPGGNVLDTAASMGVELLSEDEYRALQTLGDFDTKTSSWILTPPAIRDLGGALFCDRRYDHVFVYHNGASSYYAARGFRAKLRL